MNVLSHFGFLTVRFALSLFEDVPATRTQYQFAKHSRSIMIDDLCLRYNSLVRSLKPYTLMHVQNYSLSIKAQNMQVDYDRRHRSSLLLGCLTIGWSLIDCETVLYLLETMLWDEKTYITSLSALSYLICLGANFNFELWDDYFNDDIDTETI